MKKIDKFLDKIPKMLASKVSVFIYLFLFIYAVVFVMLSLFIPAMGSIAPSADTQMVLGNYTNVLSALGASIAAGSGLAIHNKVSAHQEKQEKMQETIDRLHTTIGRLHDTIDQLNEKIDSLTAAEKEDRKR